MYYRKLPFECINVVKPEFLFRVDNLKKRFSKEAILTEILLKTPLPLRFYRRFKILVKA